jgi:phage protein D
MSGDLGASGTTTPLVRVLANGVEVPGCVSVELTATNFYQAARFSLVVAANASPMKWWDVDPPLLIKIQIEENGGGFQSAFSGEADNIQWSPDTGSITLDGRDLSSRYIETKTQAAYQNKTSSEIATLLAEKHGMTADVTATTTLTGRYYQIDHNQTAEDQFSRVSNEWDLLTYLAQHEGFDLWVTGSVLHFKPPDTTAAATYTVQCVVGTYTAMNVENLHLERSYTLAKDLQVDVRSWSSRSGKGFTKSVRALGAKNASSSVAANQVGTDTQRYTYVVPNLTEDQALQYGQNMLKELTFHERVITFDAPATLALTPRSVITVQGTSSSWDQTYHVDTITLSLSFDQGYNMSVRAKNSSTRSQVIGP